MSCHSAFEELLGQTRGMLGYTLLLLPLTIHSAIIEVTASYDTAEPTAPFSASELASRCLHRTDLVIAAEQETS